ncbi:GLE1-like protein-domain-containing protein [Dichotomocladium elegans]|nr:GLE1-like protein-domain-containing protein [Dichotomocladium elegans]
MPELASLAKPIDAFQYYQESLMHKTKPRVNPSYLLQQKQHHDKIEQMKQQALAESRRKYKEDIEKMRKHIQGIDLSLVSDQSDLDDEYEEYIKETRARIERAIKNDKDKFKKEADRLEAQRIAKEKEAKEKEAQQKKELDARKKAEETAKAEAERKEQQAKLAASAQGASISGLEQYKEYTKTLDYYREHYRPRLQDNAFRKVMFQEKLPIKRFIKQLQFKPEVVEQRHVAIRDRLLLIKSQSVETFHCLLNQMAKDFLLQVRAEVSSISWASYFYARLAMLLMADIPEFTNYLMGRLYKRCPYMIPEYHDDPKLSAQEMMQLQRYEYVDDKKTEFQPTDMHFLYQYSYLMFYAALVQMTPIRNDPPNPHGIQHGWVWLARVCNVPPRPITAGLIHSFLMIAGQRLLQEYPNQTPKVFRVILQHVLPATPRIRENASPVHELERILTEYFQTGVFPKMPEKMEKK